MDWENSMMNKGSKIKKCLMNGSYLAWVVRSQVGKIVEGSGGKVGTIESQNV